MTLRTRLALVLVALVLVPLVAAAILVLYAVPTAAADRADSLVARGALGGHDDLVRQCDEVGTAAVVTGRMLGSTSPARATRSAVDDGLADWVAWWTTEAGRRGSAGRLATRPDHRPVEQLRRQVRPEGRPSRTELQVVVDRTPRAVGRPRRPRRRLRVPGRPARLGSASPATSCCCSTARGRQHLGDPTTDLSLAR